MNYSELLFLGAFAGLTIFLGLPLAVIQGVSSKKKGFLNALAIGILIFLTVDVFSHAWESAQATVLSVFAGKGPVSDAALVLVAMFGGIAIGLLGLTWYEARYMKPSLVQSRIPSTSAVAANIHEQDESQLAQQVDAYRFSMMIAVGIGSHNFSEGLAIGQSYMSGAIGLAMMLIIGFAAHNATEGFGIAAPLTGLSSRPRLRFLLMVGLVGGGPTFIGTVIGSLWASTVSYIFFLSVAGGALVYVSMLMYNAGRKQAANSILMLGFFAGIVAGFITDLLVTLGGA